MHCLREITSQKAPEQRRRQVQRQTVTEARAEATPGGCDTTAKRWLRAANSVNEVQKPWAGYIHQRGQRTVMVRRRRHTRR